MNYTHQTTCTCLGIDPGTLNCGWAIIDYNHQTMILTSHGIIHSKQQNNFDDRILNIHYKLNDIIQQYTPSSMAIESPFIGQNAKTSIQLGQLFGVIKLTAKLNKLSTASYNPMQVKKAVSSYGWADKIQVSKMIAIILNLKTILPSDASDAAAVAISHILSTRHCSSN